MTQLLSSKPTLKYMRGLKGHQEASHKAPVTHTVLETLGFPVATDSGVLVSSVQRCGSKFRRESYLHSVYPSKLLYCSPFSTTNFCINFLIWLITSTLIFLKQNASWYLRVLQCSFAGTSSLKPPPLQRSWDTWKGIERKLEKIGFPLYQLKVNLELSLLKCRFVKEIKIVITCPSLIIHSFKNI